MTYEIVKRPVVNRKFYTIKYKDGVGYAKLIDLETYFASDPFIAKEDTFIIGYHKNVLLDVTAASLFNHDIEIIEWWVKDKTELRKDQKYYFDDIVFDPPVKLNPDGTLADD